MSVVESLEMDLPVFHWGGTRRWNAAPETLREIQKSVRPGMRTLETGCGASTVVFAAGGARHTVISPTHDEHERVLAYLQKLQINASEESFEAGFSDDVLPRISNLPQRQQQWDAWCAAHFERDGWSGKESGNEVKLWVEDVERDFDYIFLDGAHSFPYPVVDWHYAVRRLKIGGRLLLDDIPVPAVACVFRYMMTDPSWTLVKISDNRAATFELVSLPDPEDYTLKSYNRRPDFGFLPIHTRTYMTVADEIRRLRRQLGHQIPALRRYWQRIHQ